MLTLFLAPGSSSMAPHIALHEVGAEFEIKPLSLARRENREPAFLAINPEGKVPTLVVDGRPLTEVAAILFFLARRYPAAGLLPTDDAEAEAHVISWMSYLAATVHPARRQGIDHARSVYENVERRLAQGSAIGGERISIADIHLFRLYWRLRKSVDLDWNAFPCLEAHHARMMERPSVMRTCEIEARIGYDLPA